MSFRIERHQGFHHLLEGRSQREVSGFQCAKTILGLNEDRTASSSSEGRLADAGHTMNQNPWRLGGTDPVQLL